MEIHKKNIYANNTLFQYTTEKNGKKCNIRDIHVELSKNNKYILLDIARHIGIKNISKLKKKELVKILIPLITFHFQ
jgi:hypothetical protein